MSILSIFKKKDDTPKQETPQQAAPKSSSSGSSNPFSAIIARETGGAPKPASSDKFKSPLSGSSSSSSPQFKAYSAPSKTGSITVKDKRTGKTVSYESTLTDKDRKELEASNPFKSMFRDTGTPSLSERSKENDRLKGIDWSTASDEQKAYNEVYYKTLDDPTHTKMYTDLEAATLGREDATKDYKENRAALDEELKTIGKDRGKDSYEYKALKAFIDSYETLGRRMASGYSKSEAARISRGLDENIQGIYGGLMAQPDFQEKAAAGLAEAKRHPVEFADLRQALEHATPIQRDLVYYLRATEGKEGVDRFLASSLGQMMTYANASQVYAKQLENDSDFLRGAAMFGQQVAEGVTSLAQEGQRLYRGFTGKDVDDPNDRNLGGGYTISDSTDDYLRAALGKDLADAGITDDIFSSLAADGLAKIQGRTEKSSWAKEIMDKATPYQKQVLGFLYEASGKDAVKETWESLKQREQAVWTAVKQGSNGVPRDVSDVLSDLYIGYANLGGMDAPNWLNSDGSKTLEGMLLEGTRSASQQLVPLLASGGVANAVGAAGASRAAAAAAGRIAAASMMSTTIGGQSYGEALQHEGVSHGEALGYGVTEAAMEFITDQLLGVAGGFGGSLTAGAREKLAARIANPVVRALGAVGISSLGEGTQEYLQEALEPIIASVFLHEGDLRDAAGEFIDPKNLLDPDRLYAGALGVLTSIGMSPGTVAVDISNNRYYSELGKAMGTVDALTKTADIILNADAAGLDAEALSDAKKTAQIIKNGGKVSDLAAGKMIVDFGKAGGDLSHLSSLDTQGYNKDSIALDDMIAGATSMLSTLDGDVGLATDVAKLAMGQTISPEAQEAISKSAEAQQVLTQLQGDLDMSVDNALTRAARATIFKGALNKVYTTLKNSNPEKNVVSPAVQTLYDSGVKINDAEKIGAVFNKVLDGQQVTEKEAKLVKASSPAIRAAALQILGLDLSEYAGADTVLAQLNELASQQQTVKEQQADIKRTAKVVARARGAAMQGGFANGLEQSESGQRGRSNGAVGETGGPGGAEQVPGPVQGYGESGERVGQTPASGDRPGQRPGAGQERNEDVQSRGVIPADQLDEGQKKLHEALVSSGFDSVEFVLGEDSASGFNPRTGKYECKIRVDGQFGQNQYADHERLHLWLSALTEQQRNTILFAGGKSIFGEDFWRAFMFVKTLYDGKGYNDGLTLDRVFYRTVEDMLCFANGGQNFRYNNQTLFDFSAYQDAVRSWAAENNLKAIGTGDLSNPAVREAMANGWINQEYYDRHGFGQEDSTEIDIGTESRAAAPRKVTPVRSQSTQRAMNNADVENLTRSVKNLRKERRRLIREAEQNGTRNSQEHREVINALNEQIEEYQSRIDDLTDQHSADYEEESYEERTADRGGVQGDVPGGETEVRSPERERDTLQKPKKNIRRKSERLLRESRDLHEDEVKNLAEFEDAEIVPDEQVPEEYRWIKEAFLNSAPDSDVTFYRDDSEYAYIMFTVPAVVAGADGGFFVNLAKLEAGEWADDGWTLDILVNHEKSHYWLDKGGKLANRAWKDLRNRILPNGNEYSRFAQILKAYRDWCSDSYHDAEEEMLCDIHAGRSLAFDVKAPELWPKVKAIVDEFFEKNTESDLSTSDSLAQHSADYDPEYFRSIGLISPDGSTAAFTDNINGVHEEILNQLNGTEGEDIKDFIARGGVRVKPGVGIEVNGDIAPTMDQYDVIDDVVENFDGRKFTIDFNINGVFAGSHTLEGADIDPSRVYSYLRNYYERRKADIARDERLTRYAGILGMPVKTMKDAYNLAKFQIQMDEDNPELQEIIDTYENQRYSADYLNPESDDYLGPEIDTTTMRNAQVEDVYRNQDMWLEDRESETDEDATGEELSLAGDEMLESQMDQLLAELDTFPERAEEIFGKIQELQEKGFNKTKHADESTETGQAKQAKKSQAKAAPKKTPVQMAFQPKKAEAPVEEAKVEAPVEEAKPEEKKPLKVKPTPKVEKKPLKVTPIPKAKPADNGVTPTERSAYEELKDELEANPELANDPAFYARAVALAQSMGEQAQKLTERAEALEAAAEPAEAATEPAVEDGQKVIVLKDSATKYARKDKGGNWWRNIGKADTIEIRRRRSDRNTYDVRITDAKGNTVVYNEVSPSMLTKAFGVKTNDRKTAMQRTEQATALAQNVSLEWSRYDNPAVEKAPVVKDEPERSFDNLGREVPARLSQYMEKSAIRTEDGALINTYRLASENGVHNAKIPGRFSMFMERPAAMNIQRGMNGAEAYGQSEKAAGEKLAKIFDKLADPKTSKEEVEKLRKQIAQLEEDNKKYVSGITRLDPFRPDFQFAQRENIVNGKSMLETYLDIRKPKVVDAKGQGLDFVQREVRNFINNPENKAGQFDANRDPIGPNDGFKFTNVKVVPEGQTLGGGDLDLDTVYVTFRNNQAKSTYNTNPTESDLLQYSADYDALVEEDAMKKGILEKKPTGFTDAKGYSISSDQAWFFDDAKTLDKEGRLVKGIIPLFSGSRSMHLLWDTKAARKTKALYLATNPKVSEGYTKVPENQAKVADLMAYEQLVDKLANSVRMNPETLADKIPALRKFAEGTDKYAAEGARRLVVMYNNALSKDNPMRGKAELIPSDGTKPPMVKYADGSTTKAADIPNFLPPANIRMVYANTTDPFVVYGNHANWRHIYMGNNKAFMDWKKKVWDQPGYEEFEMKPDSTYVDTDTVVQYVLEETKNDSVIFHDIMDAIGQHPDGYGDVYVVFDPAQVKSVNNRHPTIDPRYNHSADYDAQVFGDMEKRGIIEKKPGNHDIDGNYISPAQASYFDQAKILDRNGTLIYGVIPLFHGGRSIYLVWNPDKAKDSRAFFLTTNPAVAETYMNTRDKAHLSPGEMVDLVKYEAKLEEITSKLGLGDANETLTALTKQIKTGSPLQKEAAAQTYAEIYNKIMGDEYGKIKPVKSDKGAQVQKVLEILEDDQYVFGDRLVELEDVLDSATDEAFLAKLSSFHDLANSLFFAVDDLRNSNDLDWRSSWIAASYARQIANYGYITDPETGEIINLRLQEQAKRLAEQIEALDNLLTDKEDVLFENEGMDGFWSTFDDLPPILPGTGASAFYANTTNPLLVDGTTTDWLTGEEKPGDWTNIDVSKNPELSKAFPSGVAATDEIAEYARSHNYDSVIIHNIYDLAGDPNDGDGAGDVYIVFNSNQIKSVNNRFPTEDPRYNHSADYTGIDTGYADGTLEDMILKVLWDKDEDHATAALTEYLFNFLQTGVLPEIEGEKTRNIFQPKVSPAQVKIIENQMAQFVKEFGPLEKGENAARNVVFPRRTDDGYTRRVFRTAAESKNTPEWTMDALKREFLLGEGTYQRISDKSAIAYADREFQRKGYDKVLAEWRGKIDTDERPTKNDVAVGEMLFNEAVKVGDMETAMRTLAELADIGTTAGQTVQAFRMLKKMPKSYQLYYFQRVANRLNRQYSKRINSGKMQEIKLDTKLSKAVLKAKTQEELDAAMDALIKNIAEQIPVTMADKWNAWRYLSMLGNPKTHIRNVLGNAIFAPAKFAKDLIAAGLETTLISDPSQRVTSFKGLLNRNATKEYRAFAEEDYEGIKTELQSGGKYNPTNAVLEARSIFKNLQLEKLRRLNGDWLEKEDGAFLKFHYVNALTNFLATKGMSLEELQGTKEGVKILNAARQYAFLEAQKATYRDASAVASALNSLKRVPGIGVLMEGLLPFTKTPINILKRGIEYSPIGLLDATTRQLSKLKNGEITANEFVDKLASGLTGTGIAILGFWLASQGLLRGGDDDDDKQADTDKLVGYQNYSINLGKTNFTIDWAAPSALPLFVGAAVFNELREKNGLSGADFYNALTVIAEPITQLSMLSGLNDTLKSAKWDDNPFASVIQSMGSGYLSQGIPTLLGQIARAATEDRRTTYVDKNSDVPQPIQRWVQTNVMGKIPGLNNQRPEYIDTWGRTDSTPGFIVRLIDNMFLPGYRNEINITPVDKELQRLADAVGTGVLVSPADRYIEFNNETHHLTADQYQTYAKVRGNQTFAMLTELFNSDAYASLSDEEKAKAVKALKDYGNVLGKQAVFPEYDPDTDNWAEKCDGDPTRLVNMALLKGVASEQGVTVSNNSKFYNLVINCDWLTPTEQAYAMAQQYTTTSQNVYISRSGHKWALTPERKQVLYQHVRDIYPAYYTELVTSSKWRKASESKRMELLKAMRDELSQDAKVWLARQLNKAGEK